MLTEEERYWEVSNRPRNVKNKHMKMKSFSFQTPSKFKTLSVSHDPLLRTGLLGLNICSSVILPDGQEKNSCPLLQLPRAVRRDMYGLGCVPLL